MPEIIDDTNFSFPESLIPIHTTFFNNKGEEILKIEDGKVEINYSEENVLRFQEMCNMKYNELKNENDNLKLTLNGIGIVLEHFCKSKEVDINKLSSYLKIEAGRLKELFGEIKEHEEKEKLKRYAFIEK